MVKLATTLQNLYDRLEPYLLVHLGKEVLDLLVDADFLREFNRIAQDFNLAVPLRWERYFKETGATHAEDSSYTNYLLQGPIAKVISFKYEDDAWQSQKYSFVNDDINNSGRIILKTAPTEGVQLDLHYIRNLDGLVNPTDELDIPDNVLIDLENLIKVALRIDYGGGFEKMTYEQALEFYAEKARWKIPRRNLGGVRSYWFGLEGDGNKYDIVDHWIGLENFTADVNGDYYYTGDND